MIEAPMFKPFTLREMTINNRLVMSPMCQYSAVDGTVNEWHLVHLGSRATGGTGLIITEMTDISPEGRISRGCAGIYKPEHVDPWKRVVDFVHEHSEAKIAIQLAHAGRKASCEVAWKGGGPLPENQAWDILSPSPIAFSSTSQIPHEMSQNDIDRLVAAFAQGARWADEAGFDMIEIHGGHGYLISSFISPLSNTRKDRYGGPLDGRMRFPLEVFHAIRDNWPEEKPISMRISAYDWVDGGTEVDDAVKIAKILKAAGLDIIDVSSGNVTDGPRPRAEGLFQTPFSERIRKEAEIPTMTVGNVGGPRQINEIIANGRADLCCMAKGQIFDPYFAHHSAAALEIDDYLWPKQYQAARFFTPVD
ncbi:MAG: NADPH dehydrogenase [Alphaproteobacteria bacterium MarineAlpha11_Bin1]|nr:MAG: NADPH dehydrogenase [Alphaproteobacteria bacterium MarineAlpha11_Bin1]